MSISKVFNVIIVLCIVIVIHNTAKAEKGDLLGCFRPSTELIPAGSGSWITVEECVNICQKMFYRLALISNQTSCFCGELKRLAEAPPDFCHYSCISNISLRCGGNDTLSGYSTGLSRPGPPTDIRIGNISQTKLDLYWGKPAGGAPNNGYLVKAVPVTTFAPEPLNPLEWLLSSETRHVEVSNLHPGSTYNISISAMSAEGPGSPVTANVDTEIGEPEPAPPEPEILERRGDKLLIRIPPAVNYNGPISKYRIVVANEAFHMGYISSMLKSFYEAGEEGLPYYIAAELDPEDISRPFIVGDKSVTNGFYNAPLSQTKDIDISIGVVSSKNFVTRVRYARASDVMVLNVGLKDEESSTAVTVLGVGVAIGVVLLIFGLGVVIILRKKIITQRRQRFSQSMPLSGPCIEIENAGFIPDEEERVDHYSNLKRLLWNIPKNFLEVDSSYAIGQGSYGDVVRGRVQHQGGTISTFVQSIPDGDLPRTEKRAMLSELDLLIKANGHDNVVRLIGICEHPENLYVVIEDCGHTLKEFLLSSRQRDISFNRFSLISESNILNIITKICDGMSYLATKKILHKRLCSRNIIMADGAIPKVSGFGLSHFHSADEKPDYVRWTAQEMFKQNNYTAKSDVWSFGCLIWEILSLGGTLYPQVSGRDVPGRVMKGMRPAQLSYVGDELYQISLHCWQLDLDERPAFSEILESLNNLLFQNSAGVLSFTHYNGFQYEPYYKELEMILL